MLRVHLSINGGLIERVIDADKATVDGAFIRFSKRRTVKMRSEARTEGFWPFRRDVPAAETESVSWDFVTVIASQIVLEMTSEPARGIEAGTGETPKSGSTRKGKSPVRSTRPKGAA